NPVIFRTGRRLGLQLESGKVSDARFDLVAALSWVRPGRRRISYVWRLTVPAPGDDERLVDRLPVRRERYDNSVQSERPDQRVRGALRDIELVRVGPQAFGRQAAGTGLCPLEDCRVGI